VYDVRLEEEGKSWLCVSVIGMMYVTIATSTCVSEYVKTNYTSLM
jgi:hypothetical protein